MGLGVGIELGEEEYKGKEVYVLSSPIEVVLIVGCFGVEDDLQELF